MQIRLSSKALVIITLALPAVVVSGCASRSTPGAASSAQHSHSEVAQEFSATCPAPTSGFTQLIKNDGARFREAHANSIRAAQRRMAGTHSLQDTCATCKETVVPVAGGISVRVNAPRNPTGLLLTVGESVVSDGSSLEADESLLMSGVAIASVRGAVTVDSIINAARELSIRSLATPRTLFLRGRGNGSPAAASAALERPELFRGLILEPSEGAGAALQTPPFPVSVDALFLPAADDIDAFVAWSEVSRCGSQGTTWTSVHPRSGASEEHFATQVAFVLARLY